MSPESLRTTRLSRPFRLSARVYRKGAAKHLFFLILCLDTATYSWVRIAHPFYSEGLYCVRTKPRATSGAGSTSMYG